MIGRFYVVWTGEDIEGFHQFTNGFDTLEDAQNSLSSIIKWKTEPGLRFDVVQIISSHYNEFPKID